MVGQLQPPPGVSSHGGSADEPRLKRLRDDFSAIAARYERGLDELEEVQRQLNEQQAAHQTELNTQAAQVQALQMQLNTQAARAQALQRQLDTQAAALTAAQAQAAQVQDLQTQLDTQGAALLEAQEKLRMIRIIGGPENMGGTDESVMQG